MDNVFITPTKRRAANAGAPSTSGVCTSTTPTPASPTVRRRAASPSVVATVKVEPPPSPPRDVPPPPSEAAVRKVANLRDSVALVAHRLLQRTPVYAAPQLPPDQPAADDRRPVVGRRLCDDFWSHMGGGGGAGGGTNGRRQRAPPKPGKLSDEHRRKLLYALKSLESRLGCGAHPSPDVLSYLLEHCAEGEPSVRRLCLHLLRRVMLLYPPHGRHMRNLYRAVLAGPDKDWKPLRSAVRRCLTHSADDDAALEQQMLNAELLDALVSVLEEDIAFWWRSGRLRRPPTQLQQRPVLLPLLVSVFWKPDQQPGASVRATRELCGWVAEAHARGKVSMMVRRLLLRLMAMAAEVTRIKGQCGVLEVTDAMLTLAGDLSRAVEEKGLDSEDVDALLCSLRPAWLSARLAASRLHRYHGRERVSGPLTLQLIHTHFLSEKENSALPADGTVGFSGSNGVLPAPNGVLPAKRRVLQSPVNSPAKKRRVIWQTTANDGDGGLADSTVAGRPDPAEREYSSLVYHVLCSHLLATGLTEVRLRMTGRLLHEATAPTAATAAAAGAGPSTARAAAAPVAAAAAAASKEQLIEYKRELEWLQDRLWRKDEAARRLDARCELYMKTVTKL